MVKFTTLFFLIFSLVSHASDHGSDRCDTHSGMSDSNVLALSSQPGFCQTYGYEEGKPECTHLPKNSHQAKHLSLHGLWPNQDACGQRYGFCGTKQEGSHCSYPPLTLAPEVAADLKKIMPSYYYGSCLERHEWNKHGSCQVLSADDYFALATRLTTAADESVFGRYLTSHQGEKVKLADLRATIDLTFGKKNSEKIYLGCKNGVLVDIYIQLPALIPFGESLDALINDAPNYPSQDTCSGSVILSNFHTGS